MAPKAQKRNKTAEKRPREEVEAETPAPEQPAPAAAPSTDLADETADTHQPHVTIEEAAAKHTQRAEASSVAVYTDATAEELQAAFAQFGKIHGVHTSQTAAALILMDPDAVVKALQAGTVTIDGKKLIVEPGLAAQARAVFLYDLDKDTSKASIKAHFEALVGEGSVSFMSLSAPWLPKRGGMVMFHTVAQAVKAERPAVPKIDGRRIGVFRDSIRTHPKAVFVKADPVIGIDELQVAIEKAIGPVMGLYRYRMEEKGCGMVLFRNQYHHKAALGKSFKIEKMPILLKENQTSVTDTLRLPHHPSVDATPLSEIVRFYEETAGVPVERMVRGRLGTIIKFRSQNSAARAFYSGPVQSTSGPLPAYWFRRFKKPEGKDARAAKRQNTGSA